MRVCTTMTPIAISPPIENIDYTYDQDYRITDIDVAGLSGAAALSEAGTSPAGESPGSESSGRSPENPPFRPLPALSSLDLVDPDVKKRFCELNPNAPNCKPDDCW